ncbi:2-keto-myo-inositol dehydratase [Hyphomonas neptunium ATCC 15444]|uniref:2-keto-myo-inositol dehydratase n=2 Tax=Hyphomonas TaxID=85 RepID=Q0C063_HYPNA|nr:MULTISPECIES: myo-inosose-2 dehydratase [Hyphomonas]ABI76592.1 2-keto-myo-inositol dehydratase [Hyphomonas neptunium ATCC 15444]KCZ90537.1 2-keto-myo-inositol dehydratase [Hyphomonas hirschiana VP5]
MRFGASPIAWSNDDMPELGADTSLDTCLTDIRETGYSGAELGRKFPRNSQALLPILKQHQLSLVGGWYSGHLLTRSAAEEIEALQDHMALLKACGSEVFIFAECSNAIHGSMDLGLSQKPYLSPPQWREFGTRLTEVADYIAAQGFRFAYHHHTGTVVETSTDLECFLAETGPSVGLTLDTGHAFVGGIDCPDLIRKHPGRIAHVHCKDVRLGIFENIRQNDASFLTGVLAGMFTVPGDGDIDYTPIFGALADIRYDNWIIIEAEQDPAKADPRTYASMGLAHVKNCIERSYNKDKVESADA